MMSFRVNAFERELDTLSLPVHGTPLGCFCIFIYVVYHLLQSYCLDVLYGGEGYLSPAQTRAIYSRPERATLERFLARMNKTLPKVARTREVFA